MREEEFYVALSRAWDAMEGWLARHAALLLGIACVTVLAMLIHGCWATPHDFGFLVSKANPRTVAIVQDAWEPAPTAEDFAE